MNEKEKILDKIKKLKSLSNSSNENEAMRSIEIMSKLMEKHNISEEKLKEIQNNEMQVDREEWRRVDGKSLRHWEMSLSIIIAKLFDCGVMYKSRIANSNEVIVAIIFLGIGEDKIVAKEMFEYVKQVLDKESNKSLLEERNKKQEYDIKINAISFKNSFMVGAVNRISMRIDDVLETRRTNYEHTQNTTALTIINTKLQKVEEFIDGVSGKEVDVNNVASSYIGYSNGIECGNNISLENQITNERNDLNQKLLK